MLKCVACIKEGGQTEDRTLLPIDRQRSILVAPTISHQRTLSPALKSASSAYPAPPKTNQSTIPNQPLPTKTESNQRKFDSPKPYTAPPSPLPETSPTSRPNSPLNKTPYYQSPDHFPTRARTPWLLRRYQFVKSRRRRMRICGRVG